MQQAMLTVIALKADDALCGLGGLASPPLGFPPSIAHLLCPVCTLHGFAQSLQTAASVPEGLVDPAANTGCSRIDAYGALRSLGCLEEHGALLCAAVAAHVFVRLPLNVRQRLVRLRTSPKVSSQGS